MPLKQVPLKGSHIFFTLGLSLHVQLRVTEPQTSPFFPLLAADDADKNLRLSSKSANPLIPGDFPCQLLPPPPSPSPGGSSLYFPLVKRF